MKLRTVAIAGVLALSGLGLIGAGAHAAFTTNSTSTQTITAGTAGVALWAGNATNGCTSQAIAVANPTTCNSITLAAETVGSAFDASSTVGVVNVGSIPVTLESISVSDSVSVGYDLRNNMGICIPGVYGVGYDGDTGYLLDAESKNPIPLASPVTLAVGATTTYDVDLYAGQTSTFGCGFLSALPNSAQGEDDSVTLTANYSG